MECKGCLCKREIWDSLLKENLLTHLNDPPKEPAAPPERFLNLEEVMQILSTLDVALVRLEGMEPTIDPQYLQLTEAIHQRIGCRIVVATNICELPSLEHTDMVVAGINAITDSLHKEYTGISNKNILENLVKVYESGKRLEVTSPFIPDYIGLEETERIAKFIAGIDKNISYVIFPYYKAGDNPWRRPTHEEMDQAGELAKKYLTNVRYYYGDEELDFQVDTIVPDAATFQKIVESRTH
ncbi:radical SAM protein [Dehalogenimonas sp. THU2]|uniref:radical SAM protein n=1 Tax=Dehalogenimonas sp. THU2 TaxID=3151121 RepID=UPI003218A562